MPTLLRLASLATMGSAKALKAGLRYNFPESKSQLPTSPRASTELERHLRCWLRSHACLRYVGEILLDAAAMLQRLLKPCHIKLTVRGWHKHGKQAWLRAPHNTQALSSKASRQFCRSRCQRFTTSCVVAEQTPSVTEELPELTDQRMSWRGRSINCGNLNESHVGQRVTICGWVHRHRGLGGVVFCDVRDSTGLIQVLCYFCASSDDSKASYMHSCTSENACRL